MHTGNQFQPDIQRPVQPGVTYHLCLFGTMYDRSQCMTVVVSKLVCRGKTMQHDDLLVDTGPAQLIAYQFHDVFEVVVQRCFLERHVPLTREVEQGVHRPLDPVEPVDDQVEIPLPLIGVLRVRLHVLDAGEDTGQRVVDLVCHARRQGADRRHFLGVGELLALVDALMSPDPRNRPRNTRGIRQAMRGVMRGIPISAHGKLADEARRSGDGAPALAASAL